MAVQDFGHIKPLRVLYPHFLRTNVDTIMKSWRDFCNRDLKIKKRFEFQEIAGVGDGGYEFRNSSGIDLKETFHMVRSEMERLHLYAAGDITFGNGIGFLVQNKKFEEASFPFIKDFAHVAAREFSLPDTFVSRTLKNRDKWTFRFLHYLPGTENGVIGLPHCDKGCFTLHWHESTPGLEYLGEDGMWRPMNFDSNTTVIIPGMQMQYISEGRVKALCHRVVSNEVSRINGRYSSVCFVDMADTPLYNKKNFGGMQSFSPGFNYEMPYEEFAKFFVG